MNMENHTNALSLMAAESNKEDIGRDYVRIDKKLMEKLGVKEGDMVELEGETSTVTAAVKQSHPADVGLYIVRIDSKTRNKAGISLGKNVSIRNPRAGRK